MILTTTAIPIMIMTTMTIDGNPFSHDTNADSHGARRVSSMYFDVPSDKALRQKIDGANRRKKFRIRYCGKISNPAFRIG